MVKDILKGIILFILLQGITYFFIILGEKIGLIRDPYIYGSYILFGLVQLITLIPALLITWKQGYKGIFTGLLISGVSIALLNLLLPFIRPTSFI